MSVVWLIEWVGFVKGYGNEWVRFFLKYILVLINWGGVSMVDLLALVCEFCDGVEQWFGIVFVNELVLVGCCF